MIPLGLASVLTARIMSRRNSCADSSEQHDKPRLTNCVSMIHCWQDEQSSCIRLTPGAPNRARPRPSSSIYSSSGHRAGSANSAISCSKTKVQRKCKSGATKCNQLHSIALHCTWLQLLHQKKFVQRKTVDSFSSAGTNASCCVAQNGTFRYETGEGAKRYTVIQRLTT